MYINPDFFLNLFKINLLIYIFICRKLTFNKWHNVIQWRLLYCQNSWSFSLSLSLSFTLQLFKSEHYVLRHTFNHTILELSHSQNNKRNSLAHIGGLFPPSRGNARWPRSHSNNFMNHRLGRQSLGGTGTAPCRADGIIALQTLSGRLRFSSHVAAAWPGARDSLARHKHPVRAE